jgi:hypothetical protein
MKTRYQSLLVVNRAKWMLMGLVLAAALLFPHRDATAGQAPVNLRSAGSFAVLAFSTITSTHGGKINGDVGSSGTTFDRGVPPVIVTGTIHLGDPFALQAQADLTTAYNEAAVRTGAIEIPDGELGGRTLPPGLYKSTPISASFGITSVDLTLDAEGDPNAVWIFQMASTLTVVEDRKVILANGAQARNIFWQVGSSATLGKNSVFKGNILAFASITVVSGARLDGSALARGGAVTLDGNTVTRQPLYSDQPWRILLMD